VKRIVVWLAIRLALAAAVAAVAAVAMNTVGALFGHSLRLAAAAGLAVLAVWWLAGRAVAAWANGALADLLHTLYVEVTGDAPEPAGAGESAPAGTGLPVGLALGVTAAGLAVAALIGAPLAERLARPKEVEIIAHRGAAGARPENTMAAIVKAVEDGADWVEIDVQETADGEVVVAHDSDFMKLAGVPLKVWDATMPELAEIDIGSWYGPAYADERTPTLAEALAAMEGDSRLLIELKYYGHDVALEERVAAIVDAAGMADRVAVMSLKIAGVEKMAALKPDWRRGVLAATAIGDLTTLDADFLALNTGQVSLGLIRRAHGREMDVYAWTVDDAVTMSRLISMGVDGLITNEPALARQVMETRNAMSLGERLALWVTDRFRIGSFDLVVDESGA
jgi:glycerophosphoryl diester phosphodiesterase